MSGTNTMLSFRLRQGFEPGSCAPEDWVVHSRPAWCLLDPRLGGDDNSVELFGIGG